MAPPPPPPSPRPPVLRRVAVGGLGLGLGGAAALALAAPRPPRTPRRVGDLAALEAFLRRLVASGSPPGLSLAVVKDGRVAYDRAFGTADGPRGIAATPDTVYHWWSMTKIPTAIATLQLAAGDALRLDAPVADLLPWFDVRSPAPDGPAVTVRHLLTHSSGLPDPMPAMIGWVHHDEAGRDQTALARRRLPALRPAALRAGEPGGLQQPELHGAGRGDRGRERAALRALRPRARAPAARAWGGRTSPTRPRWRPTRRRAACRWCTVYTPLLPLLLDARALVRERRGRLLWLRRVYPDAAPPSGLLGPAPDAARLLLAYLAGGALDGARVLPPEGVRAMTYEGRVGGRGLGWAVRRAGGRLHLQHPGGGPGFATLMRVYPEERLGVVVLANGTDLDYDGLADLLASLAW